MHANHFCGVYLGIVVDNRDPEPLGRIKVNIPQVLGTATSGWMPGVNTGVIPQPGQRVWVAFQGGDCDYPVYLGLA